jgi:hypothetical protein
VVVRPADMEKPPSFGRLRSCRLPNTLNAWLLFCQFCCSSPLCVDAFHYANDISANRMVRKVLNDYANRCKCADEIFLSVDTEYDCLQLCAAYFAFEAHGFTAERNC